ARLTPRGQPPATARTSSTRSPAPRTVAAAWRRSTGSPLRSTTTQRLPSPSARRRSSTVAPSSRSTGLPLAITCTNGRYPRVRRYPHRVDEAVTLEHVRRTFGPVVALDDLSMLAPRGTVTVLVGPNGAGKTTAVRVITGELPADNGRVSVFGLDPIADGEEVRRRCGVVA